MGRNKCWLKTLNYLSLFHSERTQSVKDVIAAASRHSRRQAQTTYDHHTVHDEKRLAIDYARTSSAKTLAESASASYVPKAGELVGLVEKGSTARHPKILVAQVQYSVGKDIHLLWYEPVKGMQNCFKLKLDGNLGQNPSRLWPQFRWKQQNSMVFTNCLPNRKSFTKPP